MPYVLTSAGGKINEGEANELDLTSGGTRKRRTVDADADPKDRRWITTYDSADVALFLAPMHNQGMTPRLWEVAAKTARSGDTLRQVTAEINGAAEVEGAAMSVARRVAIGLAMAPYLADHAGFQAWAAAAAKVEPDALTADEQEHLAVEAATWAHRASWEAGQKDMAFDLAALVDGVPDPSPVKAQRTKA